MKTSELTGAALDWAVAKCEGLEPFNDSVSWLVEIDGDYVGMPWYSVNWEQGGAIIERELISLECCFDRVEWCAWTPAPEQPTGESFAHGETPLIAAMRCYVASKLGDEIDIPEELL